MKCTTMQHRSLEITGTSGIHTSCVFTTGVLHAHVFQRDEPRLSGTKGIKERDPHPPSEIFLSRKQITSFVYLESGRRDQSLLKEDTHFYIRTEDIKKCFYSFY